MGKFKNKKIMLALASALLALGSIAQAKSTSLPVFDAVCGRDSSVTAETFVEGSPLEADFMTILNSEMCSTNCPCSVSASWTYNAMEEKDLGFYKRSHDDLLFTGEGETFATFQQ